MYRFRHFFRIQTTSRTKVVVTLQKCVHCTEIRRSRARIVGAWSWFLLLRHWNNKCSVASKWVCRYCSDGFMHFPINTPNPSLSRLLAGITLPKEPIIWHSACLPFVTLRASKNAQVRCHLLRRIYRSQHQMRIWVVSCITQWPCSISLDLPSKNPGFYISFSGTTKSCVKWDFCTVEETSAISVSVSNHVACRWLIELQGSEAAIENSSINKIQEQFDFYLALFMT